MRSKQGKRDNPGKWGDVSLNQDAAPGFSSTNAVRYRCNLYNRSEVEFLKQDLDGVRHNAGSAARSASGREVFLSEHEIMNLYKYLIPDRIDVLKNQSIRFSQHMALNDPFEMKPFFELLAADAIMKRLFCFGGEDTWNAGFDLGYSMIRTVFDEMKKHFPDEASTREIDEIWNELPSYQSHGPGI